jgi:sterol desaturase/sphingolipid hydroxylase (fatty acid hydroxylase superfamily)
MSVKRYLELASIPVAVATFGVLLWLERRRPLRSTVEPKTRHMVRNIAAGGLAAAALQVAERPVASRLTYFVERHRVGLLKALRLPRLIEILLAVLLMDYTLYLWHVLTHKVPLLWRLHLPHHIDLDLDASTALRFHFAELIVAVVWRAGQIIVIGVSPTSYTAWQLFLLPSILFHHSNVELTPELDASLNRFIVTPRMHGIHHSIERDETDSNWSSGLTIWDKLHGTYRSDVPQDEITIGVPAYREPAEVTFATYLTMAFKNQRPTWQLPELPALQAGD